MPLLEKNRLAKWCVVAAASFIFVGIIFVKGAVTADLMVFGAVLIGIGFLCGYYAHKLNPRIVRRFLDD